MGFPHAEHLRIIVGPGVILAPYCCLTFEFTGLRGFSRRFGGVMGWAYAERSHRTAPIDLNLEMPRAPRSFRDLDPGAVSAAITASRGAS